MSNSDLYKPNFELVQVGTYHQELINGHQVGIASVDNVRHLEEVLKNLPQSASVPDRIITPELLTLGAMTLYEMQENYDLVLQNFETTKTLSRRFPDTTIHVGHAHRLENGKLINCIVILKNGFEQGIIPKTHYIEVEKPYFDTTYTQNKPSTGELFLICSDLIPEGMPELRRFYGNPILKHPLITEAVNTIFLSSCWGAGSMMKNAHNLNWTQEFVNSYYRSSLLSLVDSLFKTHKSVQRLVVCDRPGLAGEQPYDCNCRVDNIRSSISFSSIFTRL